MATQNSTSAPQSTSSTLEKTSKAIGIVVAVVGVLISILSYLRGCESPKPVEDHDAKLTQQLAGTWFRDGFFTVNGEDIYVLERIENSAGSNSSDGYDTTTTMYTWRY